MLTCQDARDMLRFGLVPGTPRNGVPMLGFHLAVCPACRALWEARQANAAAPADQAPPQCAQSYDLAPLEVGPVEAWRHVSGLQPISASSSVSSLPPSLPLEHRDVLSSAAAGYAESTAVGTCDEHDLQRQVEHTADHVEPHAANDTAVSYRQVLQNRNFRYLWLGQAASTFGSYFTRIAIPVFVFELTNSYAHLGFAAFSSLIASLLFGLFAGALVDRWDRRRTMINADLANAALLLGMLVLIVAPLALPAKLVGIYVVNFAAALLREIFNPARIAIFADVVEDKELLAANSLDQATTTVGELLSYPLAAFALFFVGPAIAFMIDAGSFVVSAMLIWAVRIHSSEAPTSPLNFRTLWTDIGEGLRTVRQLPLVRQIVLLSLIVPLLISLVNTLQLPFAVEALGSTKEIGFPALEGAMASGFACGLLIAGRWGQKMSRQTLLTLGIAALGVTIMAEGLVVHLGVFGNSDRSLGSTTPWTPLLLAALPIAVLIGAANSLVVISIRTTLQEHTPHALIGRVASIVSVAAGLGLAVGSLLTGLGQGHAATVLSMIGVVLIGIGVVAHLLLRVTPHVRWSESALRSREA